MNTDFPLTFTATTAENILILLGGYLIGSVPFAYLFAKWFGQVDLRNAGSRNIGARNAYEVTNKRWVGIVVLILDLLKGGIPILICECSSHTALLPFLAGAILVGHCYPVWLKFHGGKGLATAAGILLVFSPQSVVLWLAIYWAASKLSRDVNVASLIAIAMVEALALLLPYKVMLLLISPFSLLGVYETRDTVGVIAIILALRLARPVLAKMRS